MKKDLNKLIERIEVFDDSYYLADTLREYAEENIEAGSMHYYLMESSESLSGIYDLLCDIRKTLEIGG